jgi:hypothetical protein
MGYLSGWLCVLFQNYHFVLGEFGHYSHLIGYGNEYYSNEIRRATQVYYVKYLS